MSLDDYVGWSVQWIEEWSQLLGGHNWYTFRFAHFEFEWEPKMACLETTLVLLGLGVRISYNYAVTDTLRGIVRDAEAFKEEYERGDKH